MPTSPVLDPAALAAPIPGPDPAGKSPTQFEGEFKRLRDAAIEAAAKLPLDDPARLSKWKEAAKFGQTVLTTGSKSLEAAARLTDAATLAHGFPGARDGFALLRRLTDDAWDRVWPKIDLTEADAEFDPADRTARRRELLADALSGRANDYQWLETTSKLPLPAALRNIPLGAAGGKVVTTAAYIPGPGGTAALTTADLEAVARAVGTAKIGEILQDLDAARDELADLRQAVAARFAAAKADDDDPGHGTAAPEFSAIESALDDCRRTVLDMAKAVGAVGPDNEPPGNGPPKAAGDPQPAPKPDAGPPTRADLYQQLYRLADQLERLEPHSPVPLLLRRAVEMEGIPFPELVRQLNKDDKVIGFLERPLSDKPAK